MKTIYLFTLLLAVSLLILGVARYDTSSPEKYMVMVYPEVDGRPGAGVEVTVEKFIVDGVEREAFTGTAPFAVEVESRNFEIYLETQNQSLNFTASYMALYKGYWQKAGLTIRNTTSARFVLTDSMGSVGRY